MGAIADAADYLNNAMCYVFAFTVFIVLGALRYIFVVAIVIPYVALSGKDLESPWCRIGYDTDPEQILAERIFRAARMEFYARA